ncbi:MAG: carboxypeptidase-like regulatory domain-containing protein [Planctomycetes bacterium]|nr:carboxypeptidase-like regulatory domain-containing protein [Planctomycetota bacterium]
MRKLALVVGSVCVAFVAWWLARDAKPTFVAEAEPAATAAADAREAVSLPELEVERAPADAPVAEPRPTASEARAASDVQREVSTQGFAYHGRVVTADDGTPIVDACVSRSRRPLVRRSTAEPETVVYTAADGTFAWPNDLVHSVPLRVERAGFGLKFAVLDRRHRKLENAMTIELARGAELVVRVAGEVPTDVETRVSLSCSLAALRQPDDDSDTFASAIERWDAPIEFGRARFVDLPPDVSLRLAVVAGRRELVVEPDPIVLEPGERRELDLLGGRGARVVGTVRTVAGEPVGHAQVWFDSATERSDSLRQGRAFTCDSKGEFALPQLGVGRWKLGLAPARPDDADPSTEFWSSPIELEVSPLDEELRVDIVAERRGTIAGRVVDQLGRPAAGVRVRAAPLDPTWLGRALGEVMLDSEEDGSFVLADLAATRARVWVELGQSGQVCDFVDVRVGARDVELVVRPAATLAIEIVDGSGATNVEGTVSYGRADAELGAFPSASTFLIGSAPRIDGLTPGVWDVVVTTRDRKLGFARVEIVSGEPRPPLRIVVAPSVELRLATNERWVPVVVRSGEVQVAGTNLSRGASERVLVPPGTVTITWRTPSDGVVRERELTLVAGARRTERLDAE